MYQVLAKIYVRFFYYGITLKDNDDKEIIKIITRARMGSELIAHEAEGRMGY